MNLIPLGEQNPLNHADGQARVLNAVLEQLFVLRAEVGALQALVLLAGMKAGLTGEELIKTRIDTRNDYLEKVHSQIVATISGKAAPDTPPPV